MDDVTPPATVALLPVGADVYRFLDDDGAALYVGRATNLRSRVFSYWGGLGDRQWLGRMVPLSAASGRNLTAR